MTVNNSEKKIKRIDNGNFDVAKISIIWFVVFMLAISIFSFLPNITSAATITMPPNNLGLVGYWSFEDATGTVATDFSGNRNHGTLTNMTNADWVAGKIGKALDFDGSNDYVSVSNNSSLKPPSTLTISAWVKIVSQPGTNGYQTILFYDTGSGHANYQLKYRDAGGDKRVLAEVRQSNGTYVDNDISQILTNGVWYHIVQTADGSNLRVYLNGVEIGSPVAYNGTIKTDTGALIFGATESATLLLPGTIDDIRIYSRALSATEIGKLYSNPKRVILQAEQNNVVSTGLVGYWPFNGRYYVSSLSTAYDASGNNNNGTVSGARPIYGMVGQALYFDGNDSILVPHSASLSFNRFQPFSISAILKRGIFNTADMIVSKYSAPGGANEYGYKFYLNSSNKLTFELRGGDSNNRIEIVADTAGCETELEFSCLYSVTYDGSSNASGVKLYIDGIQISATATVDALTGDTTTNNPDLYIGIGNDAQSPLRGYLDEIRIYNRVVTGWELGYVNRFRIPQRLTAVAYTPPAPSYDFSTLSNGLIQHITFDTVDYDSMNANFVDKTEFMKDATYGCDNSYVPCPSLVSGKRGQAVVLDENHLAVDESPMPLYITLAKPTTTSSVSAITFSFWAKDGASSEFQVLADFTSSVGIHNPNNTGGFSIQAGVSGVILNILDNIPVSAVWREIPFTGNRDTSWHLYTFTTNGTTVKTYYDGSLVDTYTLSYNLDLSVYYSFTLGATQQGIEYSSNGYYFTGNIDDLRVYDRALSASEITALYNYVD